VTFDAHALAFIVSLAGLAVGVVLWVRSFFEKLPLRRLRQIDCGTVLVFSSILLRFVGQTKPLTVVEWALALISPLFVAGALWRLSRTACPPSGAGR
jgi:hypothetical protein